MISGANYIVLFEFDGDVSVIDKVIFTLAGKSKITKEYPTDVTFSNGIFKVPLTQENTIALAGTSGRYVVAEAQINYSNKSVSKKSFSPFHISGTLATSVVTGNVPSGDVDIAKLKFDVDGDVVIAKVDVTKQDIDTEIASYLAAHPVPTYDDTEVKGDISSLDGRVTALENGGTSGGDSAKNIFPSYWEQVTVKQIDEGVYLNSKGAYASKSTSKVYVYDVQPNKYYWFLGVQGVSQAMCSYKADGTLIDKINDNSGNKNYYSIKSGIYKTPANCAQIKVCYYGTNQSYYTDLGIGNLFLSKGFKGNDEVLTGKKWAICGDSYTAGDWSADNPDKSDPSGNPPYDTRYGAMKTYAYNVADRTNIEIVKCARGGIDFVACSGATSPFSDNTNVTGFYIPNYSLIPTDVDYITFQFGLNEISVDLGTKGDTTNTTLWGAYDVVFKWLKTNIPKAKIGIIISDAWLPKNYHDALIEISKYYGVPYLDLSCFDNAQPSGCYTSQALAVGYMDATVNQKNRDTWLISEGNNHPNLASHLARSYVVESFLKSL